MLQTYLNYSMKDARSPWRRWRSGSTSGRITTTSTRKLSSPCSCWLRCMSTSPSPTPLASPWPFAWPLYPALSPPYSSQYPSLPVSIGPGLSVRHNISLSYKGSSSGPVLGMCRNEVCGWKVSKRVGADDLGYEDQCLTTKFTDDSMSKEKNFV